MRAGRLTPVLGVFAAGLSFGAAEAAASLGWTIEPTPNPTGTSHSELEGVSCAAARTCTAVGFYKRGAGRFLALAERWNGKRWTIEHTPSRAAAKDSALVAVSCTAARTCTAVGFHKRGAGRFLALAERWNGKRWTIEPTPNPGETSGAQLYGVSCTAARTCTAVGYYLTSAGTFRTLAERWNGKNWRIEPTLTPAGGRLSFLDAVSCTGGSGCTTVGSYTNSAGAELTLAERWNGNSWRVERTPNPPGAKSSVLDGVSCTKANLCTAVGSYRNSVGKRTLAERWNGKHWTIEPTPTQANGKSSRLYGVSCTKASVCTAVGPYRNRAGKQLTLAERWNGKNWAIEPTPNPPAVTSACLYGVSCTTAGTCTAVGHYRNRAGRKLTLAEQHQ